MPGELAPRLALAFAAEAADQAEAARLLYWRVTKLDPGHTSACFGLARCLNALGDIPGALGALELVAPNHSLYMQAKISMARTMLDTEKTLTDAMLEQAAASIESITIDGGLVHQFAARLLSATLGLMAQGKTKENRQRKLMGHPLAAKPLRAAAEAEFRQAGRYAKTEAEKIHWIDRANLIRPRTLI